MTVSLKNKKGLDITEGTEKVPLIEAPLYQN